MVLARRYYKRNGLGGCSIAMYERRLDLKLSFDQTRLLLSKMPTSLGEKGSVMYVVHY